MSIYNNSHSIYKGVSSLTELENKFSCDMYQSQTSNYEIMTPNIGLSKESITFLNTYNEIFRRSFKSRIIIETSLNKRDVMDYSPLINELAKIFELELNLSIVQWMRSEEGIEMPIYYNKYKPCSKDYIWRGKINFNKKNSNGILRGIPIGNAYCYAEDAMNRPNFPKEITVPKRLFSIWDKIRVIRNEAAHSGISTFEDYKKMVENFKQLIDEGYLNELMLLKQTIIKQ